MSTCDLPTCVRLDREIKADLVFFEQYDVGVRFFEVNVERMYIEHIDFLFDDDGNYNGLNFRSLADYWVPSRLDFLGARGHHFRGFWPENGEQLMAAYRKTDLDKNERRVVFDRLDAAYNTEVRDYERCG